MRKHQKNLSLYWDQNQTQMKLQLQVTMSRVVILSLIRYTALVSMNRITSLYCLAMHFLFLHCSWWCSHHQTWQTLASQASAPISRFYFPQVEINVTKSTSLMTALVYIAPLSSFLKMLSLLYEFKLLIWIMAFEERSIFLSSDSSLFTKNLSFYASMCIIHTFFNRYKPASPRLKMP